MWGGGGFAGFQLRVHVSANESSCALGAHIATKIPCIYVFLFWELRGLSPKFHILVSVHDLYISRIGQHMLLQKNWQTDLGNIYISHRYMSVGTGRQNIMILFWKEQFHFWEYINGNQKFILDSHRPFICSANTLWRSNSLYILGRETNILVMGPLT
jgi:hypothetical protein